MTPAPPPPPPPEKFHASVEAVRDDIHALPTYKKHAFITGKPYFASLRDENKHTVVLYQNVTRRQFMDVKRLFERAVQKGRIKPTTRGHAVLVSETRNGNLVIESKKR